MAVSDFLITLCHVAKSAPAGSYHNTGFSGRVAAHVLLSHFRFLTPSFFSSSISKCLCSTKSGCGRIAVLNKTSGEQSPTIPRFSATLVSCFKEKS